jgi:hypothetical protein
MSAKKYWMEQIVAKLREQLRLRAKGILPWGERKSWPAEVLACVEVASTKF